MCIAENLKEVKSSIPNGITLVAVSKFKPAEDIMEAYKCGQRIFGESRALELVSKYEELPKDIEWHFIGHLQTNKVKYIAPFVSLIHSVDSVKLLDDINAEAKKNQRVIDCLLQIHISKEETKFGFTYEECRNVLNLVKSSGYENVKVVGLMGMATNTEDMNVVRTEFRGLRNFYDTVRSEYPSICILSMGMSHDYVIAVEEGSTMVRIGSKIFGERINVK